MKLILLVLLALSVTSAKNKSGERASGQCVEYVTQYADVTNSERYDCEFKLSEFESECVEKTKKIRVVDKYSSWADFREATVYGVPKKLYSVRYHSDRTDRSEYTYDSEGKVKNWRGKYFAEAYLQWDDISRPTRGVLNLFGGPAAIGTATIPFTRTYGKNTKDSVTQYDLREIDVTIFPRKKLPKIIELRFDEAFGVSAIFTTYSDNSRKTTILQILSRNRICN